MRSPVAVQPGHTPRCAYGALEREVGAARERFGDGAVTSPRVTRNGDSMVVTNDEGRKGHANEARSLGLWGGRVVGRWGVPKLRSRRRRW
jgi:hypothetical protein